jgi:hypothetical protein
VESAGETVAVWRATRAPYRRGRRGDETILPGGVANLGTKNKGECLGCFPWTSEAPCGRPRRTCPSSAPTARCPPVAPMPLLTLLTPSLIPVTPPKKSTFPRDNRPSLCFIPRPAKRNPTS